ncbi:MAG TPA: DUF1206 domain-containing protein, partial [Pseudonocardia sp.]|nr:DUF1206 domain-containing protein [Pseudonocardia sp.]
GLVSYGLVHVMIAVLALQVAFGDSEKADKSGALGALAGSGAGRPLLWVITVGLVALVGWQLAEAVWGHLRAPARQRALRIGINLAEAGVFGALAWSAGKIAAKGASGGGGSGSAQGLFGLPGGRYLVGLLGLGVLGVAGYAAFRGVAAKFLRELDLRGAGLRRSFLVTRLGRLGWTALGVAYGGIGVLLLVAAVRFDPDQPVGLDAALQTLGTQPFGRVLLCVLAAGLAVFGVYCLFDARYRAA